MEPSSYWIQKYNLQPHPEGGYYAETYRSAELISSEVLPGRFNGSRAFSTAIFFLLEAQHFSAFHRIQSDEMWHFYAGEALEIFVIDRETGHLEIIRLGRDPEKGEVFQAVVPAGRWFGSRPAEGSTYSLVGCTVSPGFDFKDFEMADRSSLTKDFPEHEIIIREMTY